MIYEQILTVNHLTDVHISFTAEEGPSLSLDRLSSTMRSGQRNDIERAVLFRSVASSTFLSYAF